MYKTDNIVKQQKRKQFSYKMPLRKERFLEIIKSGSLFSFVQCDIEVPKNLREVFASFPPIFNNNNVSRDDTGPFVREYARKEGLLTEPEGILVSKYFMENGTINTPLLLFYLNKGLVCKKTYRFVRYYPMRCFNNFVQFAVNARRGGGENQFSSVVAETMKLLTNSFYGYPIIDRSQQTVTKHLIDERNMELSIEECLSAWVF